ncbi:MAG: chemotaxis protein CheW [Arenicella sp.]|nr:chemotaxis protein CheW [Arenicella sp.]
MSTETLDCYILPSAKMPLLLPVETISEVVAKPEIEMLTKAPANWMKGHVNWRNQRLPVVSYVGLHDAKLKAKSASADDTLLVVLNPIPNAARKTYSGLLCHGEVKRITVEPDMEFGEVPEDMDKRYIEAVVKIAGTEFIVPRLVALGVAFSYF